MKKTGIIFVGLLLVSCQPKDEQTSTLVVCAGAPNQVTCEVSCVNDQGCIDAFYFCGDESGDRDCHYNCDNGMEGTETIITVDGNSPMLSQESLALALGITCESGGVALSPKAQVKAEGTDAITDVSPEANPEDARSKTVTGPVADSAATSNAETGGTSDGPKQICHYKTDPLDESALPPDFRQFLTELKTALAARDIKFVKSILFSGSQGSFGGDSGVEGFIQDWKLDDPDTGFWNDMTQVLSQGGGKDGESSYVFPYYNADQPDDIPESCWEYYYGLRVGFVKRDGRWVIEYFLAGD